MSAGKQPKKPSSAHSISSIESTGFDVDAIAKSEPSMMTFQPVSDQPVIMLTRGKAFAMPAKATQNPSKLLEFHRMPTYESNADTSSLRGFSSNAPFIKLTTVNVKQDDRPDGLAVGILRLLLRDKLSLLQLRVVLQNGYLGVLINPSTLGQVGLQVNEEAFNPDFNLAALLAEPGKAQSFLLAELVLFDEKLFSQLKASNYPFAMRSSFETITVPELAIRPWSTGGDSRSEAVKNCLAFK